MKSRRFFKCENNMAKSTDTINWKKKYENLQKEVQHLLNNVLVKETIPKFEKSTQTSNADLSDPLLPQTDLPLLNVLNRAKKPTTTIYNSDLLGQLG